MKKTILTTLFSGALLIAQAQIYSTTASSIANAIGTTVITTGINAGQIAAGTFTGTSDFDPGTNTYNLTAGTNGSMYVQSLGTNNEFYWAFSLPNVVATEMVAASDGFYITGNFTGMVDFNPNPSITTTHISAGLKDCFIMKVDYSTGNVMWVKSFGGTNDDLGVSITSEGNVTTDYVYVTGTFKGTADLDPTSTTSLNFTSNGGTDIFVVKVDASGTHQWSRIIGGTGSDYPSDIKIGDSYVTISGAFSGTVDFDPNTGVANQTGDSETAFLVRWNTATTYQWSRSFDQPNDGLVHIRCILVTPNNIYIAGDIWDTFYYSTTSSTSASITPNNLNAAFYAKLDAVGFGAEWVKLVDNPPGTPQSQEAITDIISDGGNDPAIYMVGTFLGTTSFTPGSAKPVTITGTKTLTFFVFKIYGSGVFKWGYALQNAEGYGPVPKLALSQHGGMNHIYTTAKFSGTQDFDFGTGVVSQTAIGTSDSFIAKWSDQY